MNRLRFLRYAGNMLILVISTLFVLITTELLMQYRVIALEPLTPQGYVDVHELAKRAARTRGEPYDARPVHQVIASARAQGRRAFPAASPAYFMADKGSSVVVDGESVFPLGISAFAENYYCNESGQFANFATDRFGFRNPDTIWDGEAEIVTVGDSFTMGSCLNEDQSIVGNLRRSGKVVLNLGMGANGPLIELASLVEYGKVAKPKVVLWNFFPNDMADLERDYRNEILKKYLDAGFSQHLIKRAAQVNPAIDAAIEEYWKRVESAGKAQTDTTPEHFYELPNIQKAFRFIKGRYAARQEKIPQPNFKLLIDIMQRADGEAKKMGAKLYFVYIPDCIDSSYGQNVWKDELFTVVKALGIPVIDTQVGIDALNQAGKSAYFYCPGSHFNAAGAKSTADQVLSRLAESSPTSGG